MKKSKKLVLSLLAMMLVVSMAFGGIITVNAADSGNEFDNTYKVGLLEALKISKINEVGVLEWTGELTRGEAAFLVAGLVQLDRSKRETIFNDVSIEAYYAGSIAALNEAGIVLKSWGSKKFKPDEPILYGEFITMISKALGYTAYAESKGGYPAGYIEVARQFKLTKGVSLSANSNVDKKYVPRLIMNALDASYFAISGIDREGNVAAEKKGVVLNDYFGTYKYEGIFTEAGTFSITNNFQAAENNITVGGINFIIKKSPVGYVDLLGQSVTVYYKEGKQTVYVCPHDKNVVLEVEAEDLIPQTTADVISYYNANGKECRAKLSSELIKLYNGIVDRNAALETAYGKISFVDNNGDGKYDVAKITEYQLARVSGINSHNNVTTFEDINTSETFAINTKETGTYKFIGANGKNVKVNSLVVDDMVLYSTNHPRYEENRYTDFVLLNNTTSGSITSIGSEEVGIGGTKYKLSELVNELPETSLGDAVKVYLDAKGNVIYMEASGYDYKASKYALYLGIDKVKGGSNPRWEISLYTQDSAIADLMIAEKISINGGSKIKTSDASVESFFAGLDSEEMIKFKTKDGELTEIFTADDWGSEYRYWDFGNGFNRYEAGNPWWRTDAGGMFSAWLPVASDALRFVIVHDANGNIVEEKSVVTTTKPIGDQGVNNLVLWDIDKNGKAHAYICSPSTENVSKGRGTVNNDFLVVTSVFDAANEEGVPGKYVFGIKQADEVEYFLSSENYAACGITETTNPVKAGNVIKIVTSGSEIVGLVKNSKNSGPNFIYFTKAELDEPAVTLSNAIGGRSYEFAAPEVKKSYSLFAKIVFVKDDLVYFVCANTAGALGKAQITNPNTCFCTKKSGTVYRYDSESKKLFNVVSWNDVQSSSNLTGSADDVIDGSTVLVNVNNGTVTDIVILD